MKFSWYNRLPTSTFKVGKKYQGVDFLKSLTIKKKLHKTQEQNIWSRAFKFTYQSHPKI